MATRHWIGGTGSWDQSTTTHWAEGAVPTATDDVIFDENSGTGTCTITVSAPCRSLQSATPGHVSTLKTLVHNASVTVTIGDGTAGANSIALDLSGFTVYTKNAGGSSAITFASTSPTQQTVNYGGFTCGNQVFNGLSGSWKLASAMTETSAQSSNLTLTAGALDTAGFAVNMAQMAIGTGTAVRSLTLGTSTVTLDAAFNGAWTAVTTTGLTLSALSSTVILNAASGAGLQLLRGGGLAYGTVRITGTGTAQITGANSFVNFERSNAAACGLQFPSNVTQTMTNAPIMSGAAGAILTITAGTSGQAATISCPKLVSCDYLSLKDSTAADLTPFCAGTHSSIVSGVTNWSLSAPAIIAPATCSATSTAACSVTVATAFAPDISASTSAASAAVTAASILAPAQAASTSTCAMSVTAATGITPAASAATSSTSATATARTLLVPDASASTSTAAAGLTAQTGVTPDVSAAESTAQGSMTAAAWITPDSAASTTTTAATITAIPTSTPAAIIPAPSEAASSVHGAITAAAIFNPDAVTAMSATQASVTAAARLHPDTVSATSSTAAVLTTGARIIPAVVSGTSTAGASLTTNAWIVPAALDALSTTAALVSARTVVVPDGVSALSAGRVNITAAARVALDPASGVSSTSAHIIFILAPGPAGFIQGPTDGYPETGTVGAASAGTQGHSGKAYTGYAVPARKIP